MKAKWKMKCLLRKQIMYCLIETEKKGKNLEEEKKEEGLIVSKLLLQTIFFELVEEKKGDNRVEINGAFMCGFCMSNKVINDQSWLKIHVKVVKIFHCAEKTSKKGSSGIFENSKKFSSESNFLCTMESFFNSAPFFIGVCVCGTIYQGCPAREVL